MRLTISVAGVFLVIGWHSPSVAVEGQVTLIAPDEGFVCARFHESPIQKH